MSLAGSASRECADLRRLLDLVPGGVCQFKRGSHGEPILTFVSERMCVMLDLEHAPSDAESLLEQVHPEDVAELRAAVREAEARLAPISTEVRARRVDEWLWFRFDAIPERIDGVPHWTCLVIDISADRAMGERMRRAARREAMGEMAAGLAHNLNNLLAAILPNIELALDTDPECRPMLEDALHATQSAAELMRQMLAFVRQETSGVPRGPVDLTALVRETMRFCRRTFSSRIRVDTRVPHEALHVLGQPSNLQQVVLNLCLNARDAMGEREQPLLEVRLVASDDGQRVELVVTDNGTGMAPDVARRLGEPFFTTKAPGLGTGLGLATVYQIVRELGGAIDVRTTPGTGTAFTVSLPRVVAAAEPVSKRTTRRRLSGHVLLIDDERLVRTAIRRQLESSGLTTSEAIDGQHALDLIAQGAVRPDVIMLDLTMPGLPGEVVLQRLLALGVTAPILIVSGHRGPSLELEGAFCVLRKPVDAATLIDTVARALDA